MKKYIIGICFMVCILFGYMYLEDTPKQAEMTKDVDLDIENDIEHEVEYEKKKIAITFDDGPHPKVTPLLLDELKKRGVKATFFVIGKSAENYPELVKREIEEGHLVGNHTYSHVNIRALDKKEAIKEIEQTSFVLERIGEKEIEYIRPPFGEWEKELEKEIDLIPVLWTVDTLDWKINHADEIVNKVVTEIEENDIILLHDCYESSAVAAVKIIDILTAEGYQFVTVDELLLD